MYKTAVIDLEEEEKRINKSGGRPKLKFSNIKSEPGDHNNDSGLIEKFTDELDLDGLPMEGEVSNSNITALSLQSSLFSPATCNSHHFSLFYKELTPKYFSDFL